MTPTTDSNDLSEYDVVLMEMRRPNQNDGQTFIELHSYDSIRRVHYLTGEIGRYRHNVREVFSVRFVWHGGAYIEVHLDTSYGMVPVYVLNVWDYEKDEPYIPRSAAAFVRHVSKRYASAMDREALIDAIVNAF